MNGNQVTAGRKGELRGFKGLVELSPDLMGITPLENGPWKLVNPSFRRVLGWSEEELLVKPYLEMIHPGDLPHTRKSMTALTGGRAVHQFEIRMLTNDGRYRWVSWEIQPQPGDGKLLYWAGRDVTSWKETEEQLLQSRGDHEMLFDSMPEGLFVAEMLYAEDGGANDYRILDANRAFGKLTGFPPEVAIGKTARELVPGLEQHWVESFARVVESGEPLSFENYTGAPQKWYKVHAFPLERKRFASLFVDVTAHRQTEQELAREKELLEAIVENVPAMIVLWDPELKSFHLNPECERVFGWTTEHTKREDLMSSVYPDPAYRSEVTRFMRGSERSWKDITMVTRAGSRVETSWANVCLSDRRLVGIGVDITQRKRAEQALRESEQRFRIMSNGLPLLISVHDLEGRQTSVNRTFHEFFGTEPGALDDGTWRDLLHPEDAGSYLKQWQTSVEYQRDFHAECRVLRADSAWRWIESWGRPRFSPEGECLGFVVASADSNDRKELEQQLLRSKRGLEQKVQERTAELRWRAYQLARLASQLTVAEQRERSRLARVLHDHLQQLLAAAHLKLDIASEKTSGDQRAALRKVKDLLTEAIQESRSLSVELSPPILREGLTEALKWLASWMQKHHNLEVALQAGEDVPISKEEVRVVLFQSTRELLFNVCKHSGTHRATVKTGIHPSGFFEITVEDRGRGFDPDTAFGQRDPAGFGLLSIRERLSVLGGELRIESQPGEGAKFTILAPLADPNEKM